MRGFQILDKKGERVEVVTLVKKLICGECKAVLSEIEWTAHPWAYCVIAKAYPNNWREIVVQVRNWDK